ncbi:hypothetical protein D3C85_1297920 [compost metagenome]
MGRQRSFHRWATTAARMLLFGFLQHPVEGRLRGQPGALIGQPRHDLLRRQAGKLGLVGDLQHAAALLWTQLVGRLSSLCRRTPILRAVLPALQAAQRQAQFGAGLRPPRSRRHGVLDQLQGFTAIRGADHSSSSFPQSASAFFRNTSRAAVSASAASLRRSSRSSCLMRFFAAFSSSRSRRVLLG